MCETMCERTFGLIGSNDSHHESHGVDGEGGVVPLVREERRRTPLRNPHEPDAPHVDDTIDRPFEGLMYRVFERCGDDEPATTWTVLSDDGYKSGDYERATLVPFARPPNTEETMHPSSRMAPHGVAVNSGRPGEEKGWWMTMTVADEAIPTPSKRTCFEFGAERRDGEETRRSPASIAPSEGFLRCSPHVTGGRAFAITPDHVHVAESMHEVEMSPSIHATYVELSRGDVRITPFQHLFHHHLTPTQATNHATPRTPTTSISDSRTASASTVVGTHSSAKAPNIAKDRDQKHAHLSAQRSLFLEGT